MEKLLVYRELSTGEFTQNFPGIQPALEENKTSLARQLVLFKPETGQVTVSDLNKTSCLKGAQGQIIVTIRHCLTLK